MFVIPESISKLFKDTRNEEKRKLEVEINKDYSGYYEETNGHTYGTEFTIGKDKYLFGKKVGPDTLTNEMSFWNKSSTSIDFKVVEPGTKPVGRGKFSDYTGLIIISIEADELPPVSDHFLAFKNGKLVKGLFFDYLSPNKGTSSREEHDLGHNIFKSVKKEAGIDLYTFPVVEEMRPLFQDLFDVKYRTEEQQLTSIPFERVRKTRQTKIGGRSFQERFFPSAFGERGTEITYNSTDKHPDLHTSVIQCVVYDEPEELTNKKFHAIGNLELNSKGNPVVDSKIRIGTTPVGSEKIRAWRGPNFGVSIGFNKGEIVYVVENFSAPVANQSYNTAKEIITKKTGVSLTDINTHCFNANFKDHFAALYK